MGARGIEVVGQQSFPDCPWTSDEFIGHWKSLLWKYEATATAHDFFIDISLFKNRVLTLQESMELLEEHLKFAKRAGFKIIRIGGHVDPEVLKRSVPLLEQYDIKLGIEIHSGSSTFSMPIMQRAFEVIFKANSPYLGVVPDMSLFCKRLSPITLRMFENRGVKPAFVEHLSRSYIDNPAGYQAFVDKLLADGGHSEQERQMLTWTRRSEWNDPKVLIDFLPYSVHFHGKFWEMDENGMETTILTAYDEVIALLVKHGYDGYISSEYEGNGYTADGKKVGSLAQVKLHQAMLGRLLGK
jgi:sugar phosphate isomerase/epimerase